MRRIVLVLSVLATLPLFGSTARAQPCCQGYGVRYYRVQPAYQYVYYAPRPPQWSLGLHATAVSTNQMFDKDAVVLGGLGGHMRFRGYRWGGELAIDGIGGEYAEGHVKRLSVPVQLSALLYLIPEGRFNLFLLGGLRVTATRMELDYPGFKREQTFAEFGFHGGVGAEIVLSRGFALTGDVRFFGNVRDNQNPAGKFYAGVDNGLVPKDSTGLQISLGGSFRF